MSAQSALDRLLAGEDVSERDLGATLMRRMASLLDGRVIERLRSRGDKIRAADCAALSIWVDRIYPNGLNPPKPTSRAEAVLLHGDSKKARTAGSPTVLLRSLGDAVLVATDGSKINVRTRAEGMGALGLDLAHNRPTTTSPIAVVENAEPFYDDDLLSRLRLDHHLLIYTHGNPSRNLLEWIAAAGAPSILHLPDYDATGLSCFLRLHAATGGLASLYVPDEFERLAKSYGNHRLALDLSKSTDRSLAASPHPIVREVARVLTKVGVGLEQEALCLL